MGYIVVAIVCFYTGYKIGRKYQDFTDLMMARRMAKIIDQRDQLEKERKEYERWERQEKKIQKKREESEDD